MSIQPGLTVKGPIEGYSIFLRQQKKGEDMGYQLLLINSEITELHENEHRSTGLYGNNIMADVQCETYTSSGLDSMLKGGMFQPAHLDEVASLGQLILDGDSMFYVRETLKGAGIDEVYNSHNVLERNYGF